MFTCEICNKTYKSRMSIMNHIIRTHHYTGQQYYDEFYKQGQEGLCENCKQPTKFLNIEDGYAKCCSIKCAMPGRAKRNIEKYGYPDNFHNPKINKLSHTDKTNKKRKQTMLDRYGVDSYMKTIDFKNKSKVYQDKNKDSMKEHRQKTMIKKYGVKYNFNRKEVIDKNKIATTTNAAKEKRKHTLLERYGVDCILKLPEIQEKAQKNSHTPEAISKIHANRDYRQIAIATAKTKKENGNKSKLELAFEQKCNELNIKYIAEYSDERYPFACDYYLPDLDCFIEIHGSWVHTDHIYNKLQDKDLYNLWKNKSKTSKYYASAIRTWTQKDPTKLKFAEQNKLNYIILWNIDDINEWFSLKCPKCMKYATYTWK